MRVKLKCCIFARIYGLQASQEGQ